MNSASLDKPVAGDGLHENDLAIWVCAGSASIISPYLFIQSMCTDRPPARTDLGWGGAGRPPALPGRSEVLAVIGGKAHWDLPGTGELYLYCAIVPVTPALERGGHLQDWRFPSRLAGIIVLFDRLQDHLGSYRLVRDLHIARLTGNRSLGWARGQGLPLVVAATGYARERFDADLFRERYALPADIPVLPGPSPADESQRGPDGERRATPGFLESFRSILGSRKITFDPDYARRLVARLVQAINTP